MHIGISYFLKGFPGLTITSGIKMYPFFKPPFLVLKNTKVYTKPNKRNFYVRSYVHDCYMILGSAYYYYVSQEFAFNNVITYTWYTYNNYSYMCGTIGITCFVCTGMHKHTYFRKGFPLHVSRKINLTPSFNRLSPISTTPICNVRTWF